MKNYVVADTEAHAKAMVRWLKLDMSRWSPKTYLSGLNAGCRVMDIMFVPPASGFTPAHIEWVKELLYTVQMTGGHILDIRMQRLVREEVVAPDGPQLATFPWDEQTLY